MQNRTESFLKFTNLSNFTGVAVNEEALGAGQFRDHGLGQEVQDNKKGHQFALFHHSIECLAAVRARLDFITQEVTTRQMGEAVLGHDFFALCAFATARASKNPNDGQISLSQGGLVNILALQSLNKLMTKNKLNFDCFFFFFAKANHDFLLSYSHAKRELNLDILSSSKSSFPLPTFLSCAFLSFFLLTMHDVLYCG